MKKKLFLFLFIGLFCKTNAQRWIIPERSRFVPEHDFRFGIGYKPFEAATIRPFGDWRMDPLYENRNLIDFDTKNYYSGARYTTNALFVEYIYQANRWFGIGASCTYFAYFNNYYDTSSDAYVGRNIAQHFSLYPTVRLSWINNPGFSMYSAFGFGGRLVLETDRLRSASSTSLRNNIAGQITLLGLTVGKKVYAFTDLSTLGTQGLLTVGIGYRLVSYHKR